MKETEIKIKNHVGEEFKKFEKENLYIDGLVGPDGEYKSFSNFLETFHDKF
jgi:hypothetical protein